MKIFLVIDSFGTGGAERSTFELGKYLSSQSIDFSFVALKRKKIGIEQEIDSLGFHVYYSESTGLIGRWLFLMKLIRQHKPDIVHSVLFESNLLARLTKIFNPRVKYLQSLVNTPYSAERERDTRLPKLKFRVVKYFDIITARLFPSYYHAITNEVLKHYRPLFNIREKCYFVIYRGRHENSFAQGLQNEAVGYSASAPLKLMNVGRQEFQKGQILILKAVDALRARGIHVKVMILGREGDRTKELKAYIQEKNLQDQVTLAGFRSDVEEQLVRAHAFLFPSYFEGLGGALIEAMAAGLPCVCSDLPVLREVIGSDDGALFFEPGNETQLANQIEKLHANPDLRLRLAKSASQRFASTFRLETISKHMVEMYRSITNR